MKQKYAKYWAFEVIIWFVCAFNLFVRLNRTQYEERENYLTRDLSCARTAFDWIDDVRQAHAMREVIPTTTSIGNCENYRIRNQTTCIASHTHTRTHARTGTPHTDDGSCKGNTMNTSAAPKWCSVCIECIEQQNFFFRYNVEWGTFRFFFLSSIFIHIKSLLNQHRLCVTGCVRPKQKWAFEQSSFSSHRVRYTMQSNAKHSDQYCWRNYRKLK